MKLNEQILDQLIEEMLSEGFKQRPFSSLNLKIDNYENDNFITDNYTNLMTTFNLYGPKELSSDQLKMMQDLSSLLGNNYNKEKIPDIKKILQDPNLPILPTGKVDWLDFIKYPLTKALNRTRISKIFNKSLESRQTVISILNAFKSNIGKDAATRLASSRGNPNEVEDEDLYMAITLKGFSEDLKDSVIKFINDVADIFPKKSDGKAGKTAKDIKDSLRIIMANVPGVEKKKLPLDPFYSDDLGIQDPTQKLGKPADVPVYVKDFFEKSGIFGGDATTTITKFNEFMQIYVDSSQFAPGNQSIQNLFNNVMVSEYFYKIILDLMEGTSKRLQGAGRKLESFMGLLLSGTPQVSYTEFDDLILFQNNKAEYYSLKLLSTSTMIYQAASTVENFWKRNPGQSIKYVAGVKDFTEGNFVTIDLYERTYNEQEFIAAKNNKNKDVPGDSIVYIGKEDGKRKTPFFGIKGAPKNRKHGVVNGKRTFGVEIKDTNLYKNTKGKMVKDTQLYSKDTDHVVFKDFGKKIASIKLPRDPSIFQAKKKQFFENIGVAVESLYEKISVFKNAATDYFSDSDETKRKAAVDAKNDLNKTGVALLGTAKKDTGGTYATATPRTPPPKQATLALGEKNQKITEEILDKLIKEVILLK
jgi:hypothetical protein